MVIVVGPIDELESLGIEIKKTNDLNNNYELENLIENIKQTWIQDYKTCYSNKNRQFQKLNGVINLHYRIVLF